MCLQAHYVCIINLGHGVFTGMAQVRVYNHNKHCYNEEVALMGKQSNVSIFCLYYNYNVCCVRFLLAAQ